MRLPLLFVVVGGLLGTSACQDASAPVEALPDQEPSAATSTSEADDVTGQYIVVFKREVQDPPGLARRLVAAHRGTLRFTYQHALKGFSAKLSLQAAAALGHNPNVAYVEQDQVVYAVGATQTNATWGLDRVDQRGLPLSTTYTYNYSGSGVTAYILDTGVDLEHSEFGNRASAGHTSILDGRGADDCNGHGTHVAGTVGGTTYGVAKAVSLVAVRVLDCRGSGTWDGVIAGIDWVTATRRLPAVANMSLGGGASEAVDQAVRGSIQAGVSYAIAAGNGNRAGIAQDACNYSPARVTEAMTIGATGKTDGKASWSNYGNCVDWFAPGVGITSAWIGSGTFETNTISGTSMATPHTAGVAALYLEHFTTSTPQQVRDALYGSSTKGIVTSSNTANNHLLYSLEGAAVDQPPTASFAVDCTELTCNVDASGSTDDSGIASYAWEFGDGQSGTGVTTSHTYSVGGTYTITLTVTDGSGGVDTDAEAVTVGNSSSGFTLSVSDYKVKGVQHVDLTWSGASSTSVDVYRDGVKVATTTNDGTHTDNIGAKGGGSYVYKVCEGGTTTCSNSVTASF